MDNPVGPGGLRAPCVLRVVSSDFRMGGDLSPPIGGGPMGGDKGPMGGGLARDSRQIREVKKLGFKMFLKEVIC